MTESQALDMILWTVVGGAVIGVGLALAFIVGGAIKLGGPEDVPECEHGTPEHSCLVCAPEDERWREGRCV